MKIAIAGCTGRMGRAIIEAALAAPDVEIVAALDRAESPDIGRDCAEFLGRAIGVPIAAELREIERAEVLIDFTRPDATLAHLDVCAGARVGAVIGTTGFDPAGKAAIAAAAERAPVVFAPNMSVGVNAMVRLVELAAKMLAEGYDIEVIEAHHRLKVDAPSGTALQLGEAAARAMGRQLADCAVYERYGNIGPRPAGSIGFATIRGGDIIGDHTVLFAGTGERIEITHRSASRMTYAMGALRAARFIHGRGPGLFDMQDVLAAA
ncbi:dihydrodipicolinate reductase [Burkholderiales bacterium GJ-E10]|nr:dihydrodipicolinate reductase [Burkholderiales bacterium GJ-E10]